MSFPSRDAVITGAGVVSPIGVGTDELWAALGGPGAFARPPARDGVPVPDQASTFSGDFDAESHTKTRSIRRASGLARMAVVAAEEAVGSSGLPEDAYFRDETAVVLATAFGSSKDYLEYQEGLRRRGLAGASGLLFSESVWNAASGHVSKALGARGASLTVVGGEESGLGTLVTARDRIRLEAATAVVAGGVEQYGDLLAASLLQSGLIASDRDGWRRDGPAPFAEGAAVLLVEEARQAKARGARVLARILGAARARYPRTREAAQRALEAALAEARVAATDVDLLVGSGAGRAQQLPELAAFLAARVGPVETQLQSLLGEAGAAGGGAVGAPGSGGEARPGWVAWPKVTTGEAFAASSALAAVVAARALADGVVPATPGGDDLETAGLRCPGRPRAAAISTAAIIATTGAGSAVAVILGAPEPA